MKLKMENYKKKGPFLDLGMKIKDNISFPLLSMTNEMVSLIYVEIFPL